MEEKDIAIRNMLFDSPISLLPPKESIRFFFGEAVRILADPPLKAFPITVEYRDKSGNKYSRKFIIDVNAFKGMMTVGGTPLDDIERHLKKFANDFHSVLSKDGIKAVAESQDGWDKYHIRKLEKMREMWNEKNI